MAYCKCGNEVHPKRAKFLNKYNKPMVCMPCVQGNDEPRKKCYQIVSGKTERGIEICDAETAAQMEQLGKRAGMGVSRGVKMNQSYDHSVYSGK